MFFTVKATGAVLPREQAVKAAVFTKQKSSLMKAATELSGYAEKKAFVKTANT